MIDQNDPRLTAFALGELSATEAKEVESAVRQSAELTACVDEIRRTSELLSIQYAQDPLMTLTEEQRSLIMDAVDESLVETATESNSGRTRVPSPSVDPRSRRRWLQWTLVAGISGILLTLGIGADNWGWDRLTHNFGSAVSNQAKSDDDVSNHHNLTDDLTEYSQETSDKQPGANSRFVRLNEDFAGSPDSDADFHVEPIHLSAKKSSETWDNYVLRLESYGYLTQEKREQWFLGGAVEAIMPESSRAGTPDHTLAQDKRKPGGVSDVESGNGALPEFGVVDKAENRPTVGKVIAGSQWKFQIPARGTKSQQEILLGFQGIEDLRTQQATDGQMAAQFGIEKAVKELGEDLSREPLAKNDTVKGALARGRTTPKFAEPPLESFYELKDGLALYQPQKRFESLDGAQMTPREFLDELRRFHFGLPGEFSKAAEDSELAVDRKVAKLSKVEPDESAGRAGLTDPTFGFESDRFQRAEGGESSANTADEGKSGNPATDRAVVRNRSKFEATESLESLEFRVPDDANGQRKGFQQGERIAVANGAAEAGKILALMDQLKAKQSNQFAGLVVDESQGQTLSRLHLVESNGKPVKMEDVQYHIQVDGFRARVLMECLVPELADNKELGVQVPAGATPMYLAYGVETPGSKLGLRLKSLEDGVHQFGRGILESPRRKAIAGIERLPESKATESESVGGRLVDPQVDADESDGSLGEAVGGLDSRGERVGAQRMRRAIVGYNADLEYADGQWTYRLDLPESTETCQIELNLGDLQEAEVQLNTVTDSGINFGENQTYHYYFDREQLASGRSVELRIPASKPVTLVSGFEAGDAGQDFYWGTRFVPEIPGEGVSEHQHAVFLLDTSLSSGSQKFGQWIELMKDVLDRNRATIKHFTILAFDIESAFLTREYIENTPENVRAWVAKCAEIAPAGATDLGSAVVRVANTPWVCKRSPLVVLLSDGESNWGESDFGWVQQQVENSSLGSIVAFHTDGSQAARRNLRYLAVSTGGKFLPVATEQQRLQASSQIPTRSWKVVAVEGQGASDILVADKVGWYHPGSPVTVVGRGQVKGPLHLYFARGDIQKSIQVDLSNAVESRLAKQMYGETAVELLQGLGPARQDLATAYSRYFRNDDYTPIPAVSGGAEVVDARTKLGRESDFRIVQEQPAGTAVDTTISGWNRRAGQRELTRRFRAKAGNPMLFAQVEQGGRLKQLLQGVELAKWHSSRVSGAVGDELLQEYKAPFGVGGGGSGDYDSIWLESRRRLGQSQLEAVRVLSSLVEANPGNSQVMMNVVFQAMALESPEAAMGLIGRLIDQDPEERTYYWLLAKCLTQLEKSSWAMTYFEVALEGEFPNRTEEESKAIAADYIHLLRSIIHEERPGRVVNLANERIKKLMERWELADTDLLVTMISNSADSRLDLQVVEPNGEICRGDERFSAAGGKRIGLKTGLGPAAYWIESAPEGEYQVKVQLQQKGKELQKVPVAVLVSVYQNGEGAPGSVMLRSAGLSNEGELKTVATLPVDHRLAAPADESSGETGGQDDQ